MTGSYGGGGGFGFGVQSGTYLWCGACQANHFIPATNSGTWNPPRCVLHAKDSTLEERVAELERKLAEVKR